MHHESRRQFLRSTGAALLSAAAAPPFLARGDEKTKPLVQKDAGADVLLPRDRVPLSFVIDDSTCLVNMGHFCMPQFAAAWPNRSIYKKPWNSWPREIPDAFVREFGQWCAEHGVRGKYSVVPYPACVGWLDRDLPGWSGKALAESLKLVRELMVPHWDIHPEMITHTRVIDLKTGRPMEKISDATMENSYPREKKSVDELAAYLAYALRILKNCGLPCEGITTPGGFGNLVKPELSQAVDAAVRDEYRSEIPHYFKYVASGRESTEPKLENVRGAGTADVRLTVNVPAGTGDWFGGWDGVRKSEGDRYATQGASAGRMVELIERRVPAVMLCHWPGMYTNGTKEGFADFKRVVVALAGRFCDETIWMKMSEIARYWAAKEMTAARVRGATVTLDAPFAAPNFTLRIATKRGAAPKVTAAGAPLALREVTKRRDLTAGTWLAEERSAVVCLDLPKGKTTIMREIP